MLKQRARIRLLGIGSQPPSGGCVLKLVLVPHPTLLIWSAAFGRLCVETISAKFKPRLIFQPPSGGCVLKLLTVEVRLVKSNQPPSGGCVLKPNVRVSYCLRYDISRLRAAVC